VRRGIERRLRKLEEKTGVRKKVTLEMLVGASFGNPVSIRQLEEVGEEVLRDDPLCRLLL
jgi:hypothetical protein